MTPRPARTRFFYFPSEDDTVPTLNAENTTFDFIDKDRLPRLEASNARGVTFRFLENGAPFSMAKGDLMISQVLGSPVEGGLGGVFLRVLGGKISWFPLTGPSARAEFSYGADGALWKGRNN